ncbi:MAG: hypothetical protein E4G95_01605 [Bacteroidia bacterium]|nr:MAG: hypothetical protein E4G95_01605 [Bacteroidia bacterium]
MKTKIVPISAIIVLVLILFSCEETTYREYKGYKPEYMTYEDLRKSVKVTQDVPLVNPGKIYFKDDFIFIVEEMEGIHIFNNSDPSSPAQVSYVEVPGAIDITISGYYLYVDSYVDLVVLNIENPLEPFEEARVKDVLPYIVPPYDNDYPAAWVDSEKGIVTGWNLGTIREKVNNDWIVYPIYVQMDGMFENRSFGSPLPGISGSGVGIGGSMARFGIKDNVLYIVDSNSMKIFDITQPDNPVKYDDIWAGWGIETMFINGDNMFLGTTTGMFIYDLKIKFRPQQITFFIHGRSCDPVVVDGNLAYITLRSGTTCGGTINSLDVVDITSLNSPELKASYPMFNPHGLGKDGDLLFICDGSQGLKIYDASDPLSITDNLLFSYDDIMAYDVIPLGSILVMIGDEGLVQYDYSDISNISILSIISAEPR